MGTEGTDQSGHLGWPCQSVPLREKKTGGVIEKKHGEQADEQGTTDKQRGGRNEYKARHKRAMATLAAH